MKIRNFILAISVLCIGLQSLNAQLDRSKAPQPGPAPSIQLGSYESFKLKNGMQVYVVENHKLPTLAVSIRLDVDPALEGEKTGLTELLGDLIMSGTNNRTKNQLDEEIDFIGAGLNVGAGGAYGYSLSKHRDKLFELMSDVVLNPAFPTEELERIRRQYISGLQASLDEPSSIASNMAAVANFGRNHPYGEIPTEKTYGAVDVAGIQAYYKEVFTPRAAYMAIVGDITKSEAEALVNKYFGTWSGDKAPKRKLNDVQPPATSQVYIHDRSSSVQSTIRLTYPIDFTPGSDDRIAVSVLSNILGGGSTGRLYKNLRETHGFTYGAYCSFSPDRVKGEVTISADVRTEVTDSAVLEMVKEMNRIVSQPITEEELAGTKAEMTGSFARSLEDPETIARFAINSAIYGLPSDYYQSYLQKLNALTISDIKAVAQKYVKPYSFNLVVVGKRSAIEKGLLKYDADGKITFLDPLGAPAAELAAAPEGVTAETVIANYLKAIGGAEAAKGVKNYHMVAEANIQGFLIEVSSAYEAPNKAFLKVKQAGQVAQHVVVNGDKGKSTSPQGSGDMEAKDIAEFLEEVVLVPQAFYSDWGYSVELMGMKLLDEEQVYVLKVTDKEGNSSTDFYSVKTGFMVASNDQEGKTKYSDYGQAGNLLIPYTLTQSIQGMNLNFTVTKVQVNGEVDQVLFSVE